MIVRCTSRRFDFLMLRVAPGNTSPERWEGLDNMKYYYACPDIPVDHDQVRRDRHRYWDCERHIYKEERLVCLDTKKPGDTTVPQEKVEVVRERFHEWILYPGQLKVNEPSMLEDESNVYTRKLRAKEDKALKDSIERQRILEQQIEALLKKEKQDGGGSAA